MQRLRNPIFMVIVTSVIMALSFNLWRSIFNNFAVEDLSITAGQIGWVHSIRELPGLIGFVVGMLALYFLEMHIAGISLVLMGIGIFLTGLVGDLAGFIAVTLVMSVGFHFFYTSKSAAVLLLVSQDDAPKLLGKINSLSAVAAIVGTLIIFVTADAWGYRKLFMATGIFVTALGLVLLPFIQQPAHAKRKQRRPPIRREYWIFYTLEFLMGSRRHIFTTFAAFLLVNEYEVSVQLLALLYLINNLIGTYLHQALGKVIARFGERRVLTFDFSTLALVFLGYAVIPLIDTGAARYHVSGVHLGGLALFPAFDATPGLLVLLVLFVFDQILSGFSIARQTYFQKIALGPEEITPNLSLGVSINHIAAVVVPITGGMIWEALGSQYTFLAGVAIVLISLGVTQYMRTPALLPVEIAAACD